MRFGIVVLAAAALLLVGCAPQPDATPTPSATALPFATDEEAFAAAEATYRAYVDAANVQRLGGDQSLVLPYLVGTARTEELAAQSLLAGEGLRVVGETLIASFEGTATWNRTIVAVACLDASATHVLDSSGADVTAEDREERLLVELEFVSIGGDVALNRSASTGTTC
jgi:hypothetical protein